MAKQPWENDPIVAPASSGARPAVEFDKPVDPMSPAEATRLGFEGTRLQMAREADQRAIAEKERQRKELTDTQAKALGFYQRMRSSDVQQSQLGLDPQGYAEMIAQQRLPLASRGALSDERRSQLDAIENFIAASLRLESGAAIGADEFQKQMRIFFPLPGAGPKEIEQKRQQRELAIRGFRATAGEYGAEQADNNLRELGFLDEAGKPIMPDPTQGRIVTAPGTASGMAMGAVEGGQPIMTPQDMEAGQAIQEAWNRTGRFANTQAVAAQFGRSFGQEEAAFLQANEGKPVTINANPTGTPTAAQEAVGAAVATPVGETIAAGTVGSANAMTLGMLDELAPVLGLDAERVQMAKRYLQERNPAASLAGEVVGSIAPTGMISRGVGAALQGTRLAGAAPLIGDVVAGAAAGAGESNENRIGGALLGGTLGGVGGAAARRVFGGGPPAGGTPPAGGAPMGGPMGGESRAIIREDDVFRGVGTPKVSVDATSKPFVVRGTTQEQIDDMIASGLVRPKPGGYGKRQQATIYFGESDEALPTGVFARPTPDRYVLVGESGKIVGREGNIPIDSLQHVWHEVDGQVIDVLPDILRSNNASGRAFGAAAAAGGRASGGAAATPDDVIRVSRSQELPVPVQLANFQRTRKFEDMQRARELAKNNEVGGPIRERMAQQQQQIAANFDSFLDQTGAEVLGNLEEQGARITGGIKSMADKSKAKYRALYKRAEQAGETRQPVNYQAVLDNIAAKLPTEQDEKVLRVAREAIARNDPDGTGQLSIEAMEAVRKAIGNNMGADANQARLGSELKGVIDGILDDAGGDVYRSSRAAFRDHQKTFKEIGIIAQLLGTKRNSTDRVVAAENVVARILAPGTEAAQLRKMRDLVTGEGGDPQAWNEVQGAVMEQIRRAAYPASAVRDEAGNVAVSPAGLKRVVDRLDQSGKLSLIFDGGTAQGLRTLSDVSQDVFTAPPGSVNFSNTSSAWMNGLDMIINTIAAGLPLPAGVMSNVVAPLKNAARNRPLRKEVQQLVGDNAQ